MVLFFLFNQVQSEWGDPNSGQYHIQTDEGPERYFRYQTNSGQYRKEKRLEDGTVIGTYAWIDGNGLLRMQDYVADNAGYRILKSKDLYVGINRPIAEAVKMAKKSSVKTVITANPTTPYPNIHYTPAVRILPNSLPNDDKLGPKSTTPLAHSSFLTNAPVYGSTTPSPVLTTYPSVTGVSNDSATNSLPPYSAPASVTFLSTPRYEEAPSTALPPINTNEINLNAYSASPQYEHYYKDTDFKPFLNPYLFQNGPTYPLDKNGQTFTGNVADGEEYNGISVTNDGFRYYIPRAYHEETALNPEGDKLGSFGYIDPFGIRRVIYYHASQEGGFKHRKNNRYVGFRATPYDPRPS